MKKIIVFAVIAISYLTSCNKQYTCTCAINGTVEVETYTMYNSKRKSEQNCKKLEGTTKTCVLEVY